MLGVSKPPIAVCSGQTSRPKGCNDHTLPTCCYAPSHIQVWPIDVFLLNRSNGQFLLFFTVMFFLPGPVPGPEKSTLVFVLTSEVDSLSLSGPRK